MLAATPPMGWNGWNQFGPHLTSQIMRDTADAFVAKGFKDAGYEYLVIDDLWHGGRDEKGQLYPCPKRYPEGMKALADYIHARGLKFGIYSDGGTETCAGQPGSQDHEEIDAQTFADWGVDYLKYDWCNALHSRANAEYRYGRMASALRATGREIIFSMCEWGMHRPWLWGEKIGAHLWRTGTDIFDCWNDRSGNWHEIENIGFDKQRGLEQYAGPGHWNDPDFLVVGLNGKSRQSPGQGCTEAEYRTQFSLWCILAAPLMIGCDVRTIDPESMEILLNHEAIAIDQDPLGKQGYFVAQIGLGLFEMWKKPLSGGELAVGLFNRQWQRGPVTAHWSDLEIRGAYKVRDVWSYTDLGAYDDHFDTELEPHACRLLRLTPV